MDEILKQILNQPMVLGPIQKFLVDFLKSQFKNLDAKVLDDHTDKVIHVAIMVLSTITTMLKMFVDHQLGQFDPTAIVQYAVSLYAATVLSHEIVQTVKPKK